MNAKPIRVAAVAQLLKLTERRVQQLVKDGILPRPVKGLYEPVSCVHGYIDYLRKLADGSGAVSLTDERTRLIKLQADLTEIELAKARGEIIQSKRAMALWGEVVSAVRQRLLSLPGRLAPVVAAAKSIPQVKEKLEESIYEVLHECTNPDIVKLGRTEYHPTGIDLFQSTPEAQGEPVGGSEEETIGGVERGTGSVAD